MNDSIALVRLIWNPASQWEGKDEFISDLRSEFRVQSKEEWRPACCSGMEFVVQLMIDHPLTSILLSGATYDLLKAAVKNVWEKIEVFYAKNPSLEIEEFSLSFGGTDIVIIGTLASRYGTLLELFQGLHEHITYLTSQGITDISQIELPYEKGDVGESYQCNPWLEPAQDYFWQVKYLNGCMTCYYNPRRKELIEV